MHSSVYTRGCRTGSSTLSIWLFVVASGLLRPAEAADCNSNDIEDDVDIASGFSQDCNANVVPDECDGLPLVFSFRDEVVPVASIPRYLERADLDGDSQLDFVVGNQGANVSTLTLLLRRYGREFEVAEYPLHSRSYDVAFADVDGDGDLDLATANLDSLFVFPNDGTGQLSEPVRYEPNSATRTIAFGDFSGDGFPDLIGTYHGGATISLYANQGDGTLAAPQAFAVGEDPRAIATDDFDGDGDLDVATASRRSQSVSVLLGGGSGNFAPAVDYVLEDRQFFALEAHDFDGDGAGDLVTGSAHAVRVLFGQGDGTFVLDEVYASVHALALTVADLDGDAFKDLAILRGRSSITMRRNDGHGKFRVAVDHGVRDTTPTTLVPGDDRNLGAPELVLLTRSPDTVQFMVNDGARPLAVRSDIYQPLPGCIGSDPSCKPHGGNVADLDGDGDIDVIASSTEPGAFSLLINDGTGQMETPSAYTFGGVDPLYTAVGDLDADGDVDALTVDAATAWVHLNRGDATFEEPKISETGEGAIHAVLVDLDDDGRLDAAIANRRDGTTSTLFGRGDGTFAERVDSQVGRRPTAVAAGDFDFDGDVDLAVANSDQNHVSLVLNGGDRTFSTGADLNLRGRPHFVVSGDIDSDGDADLVTANMDTATASVIINTGSLFLPAVDYPTGPEPFSVFLADYDTNGIVDVGTSNESSSNVSLLLGRGGGALDRPQLIAAGGGPRFTFPADFDQDGDPDLVSIDRGSFSLTIIHNELLHQNDATPFLMRICTGLDFHRSSTRRLRGDVAERVLHYLLPLDAAASPLPNVAFLNSERFPLPEDFLRVVFPEVFGDLTPPRYRDLVESRGTREYFAGTIIQVPTDGGLLYGFTVDARWSDSQERLERREVERIALGLAEYFLLEPLMFLPDSPAADEIAAGWGEDPGFLIHRRTFDVDPTLEHPAFELVVPSSTVACGTFDIGREPREEFQLQSRIVFSTGVRTLPTDADTVPATLIRELMFGPTGEVAKSEGSGLFRVASFAVAEDSRAYRFTYEQSFTLEDGRRLVVDFSLPDFRVDGDTVITERFVLDESQLNESVFLRARVERGQARTDLFYTSCHDEDLPLWEVRAELDNGVSVRLAERYRPEFVRDFGPASLVEAEVRIGPERQVVQDYFSLVYSARRHNRRVVYWTVLDPPLPVPGVEDLVQVVELRAPVETTGDPARASYLGENLGVLATVDVLSYEKEEVATQARFRRGDLDGDGGRDITDALALLHYLFRRGEAPLCRKAADTNDDGRVHVLDAVTIVRSFLGDRTPLPAPASECGTDPTPDRLPCSSQCE